MSLTFIYTKIGFQNNYVYKILEAKYAYDPVEIIKNKRNWVSLFINWEEAAAKTKIYNAPLPKAQWWYLPDNTLYPFFVEH